MVASASKLATVIGYDLENGHDPRAERRHITAWVSRFPTAPRSPGITVGASPPGRQWCSHYRRATTAVRRSAITAAEEDTTMATSATTTNGTTTAAASAVPHLSVAERVARGKAARDEVPRASHAVYTPSNDPGRSARCAGAAGHDPCPRAGADSIWPDARVAVHVLPRRRDDHGRGSGRDATVRLYRPVLRGCASVELRRVCLSGAPAGVRRQRLRRDAPRPVGVGCQAPRGEHADRRRSTTTSRSRIRSGSSSTRSRPTAARWRTSRG